MVVDIEFTIKVVYKRVAIQAIGIKFAIDISVIVGHLYL